MRNLLHAGRQLLLDMASTIVFLVVFLLTHEITLSVGLGMVLGIAQIGWQFSRKKPIDTMEWLSLFLVVGSGTAILVTNDPRFIMFKPSLIYVIVGLVSSGQDGSIAICRPLRRPWIRISPSLLGFSGPA